MNIKPLAGVGCLLLLAAMMAPAALAHDDENDDRFTGASLTDNLTPWRPASAVQAVVEDGVSGRYVGAGLALINSGSPITIPSPTSPSGPPIVITPSGVIQAGGIMYCDLEVVGHGLGPSLGDEIEVDRGDPLAAAGGNFGHTGAPNEFANAHSGFNMNYPVNPFPGPDSTTPPSTGWDDGGLGGACHLDGYGYQPYNTLGCPPDLAYAQDDLWGDVFIGASCDWESQGNGTDVCGADGAPDGTNYGWGNGGVPYPAAPQTATVGETYDPVSGDDDGDFCPGDALAAVFVFDTFDIATGVATVATRGDIWQET